MKIALIIVVFLLLNAFLIVSNNELALNESENWETLRELYFNWINGLKTNLVDITGEVIGMQWISDEV